MDIGQGILLGMQNALTPGNLLVCFLGVLWGTLIGVLPGIGPVGGMTILMPLTFGMDVTSGLIMMAGIYYGSMYGGSTTSILAAIPGEVASAVTVLDGHQMALKGRAGLALSLSAIGSFVAGTVGVIALSFVAPALVSVALDFGPPEYFALAALGLSMAAYLGSGSLVKGISMGLIGLTLSTVGMHITSGETRFTFNRLELLGGIEVVAVLMGIFGVAEVLVNIEKHFSVDLLHVSLFDFRKLLPSRQEWRVTAGPMVRGSLLGFVVGILPGSGATVSSFLSYAIEKRISKHPERFGTGIPEGVAGPEAANNAAAAGAMIPLLSLGVPYNVVTAIMLSAMIVHGVFPSPLLMEREPLFFWTVICSMYIGNVMLLVLNLPLTRFLGQPAAAALSLAVPHDPALLHHRRLLHQFPDGGSVGHDAVRALRLLHEEIGFPGRSIGARHRTWPPDGECPHSVHDPVGWQPYHPAEPARFGGADSIDDACVRVAADH